MNGIFSLLDSIHWKFQVPHPGGVVQDLEI